MINWHHSPANLYKKWRKQNWSCKSSAGNVLRYYGLPVEKENILEFLKQIDPDGHKQCIEYLEMVEAIKDKYTEMGIL